MIRQIDYRLKPLGKGVGCDGKKKNLSEIRSWSMAQ